MAAIDLRVTFTDVSVYKFTSGIIGFISMFSYTFNSYFLKIIMI